MWDIQITSYASSILFIFGDRIWLFPQAIYRPVLPHKVSVSGNRFNALQNLNRVSLLFFSPSSLWFLLVFDLMLGSREVNTICLTLPSTSLPSTSQRMTGCHFPIQDLQEMWMYCGFTAPEAKKTFAWGLQALGSQSLPISPSQHCHALSASWVLRYFFPIFSPCLYQLLIPPTFLLILLSP